MHVFVVIPLITERIDDIREDGLGKLDSILMSFLTPIHINLSLDWATP